MSEHKSKRRRGASATPSTPAQASVQDVVMTNTSSPQANETASSASNQKGPSFHCNYCSRDISEEVRIKCAQCSDFDLCVDCFMSGAETGGHENNHPYRVMDDMNVPLYTSRWGADEEVLLLEGIELFGLGNWADVAEHVGTKNMFQCEYHYWSVYIDSKTGPLPPNDLPEPIPDKEITAEDVKRDDRGLLLSIIGKDKAFYFANQDSEEKRRLMKLKPTIGQEVNYMPYRGDYETEYVNSAEDYLAEMEIMEEDSPQDRRLKLKMLEMYNFIIEERELRKQFSRDRQLMDFTKIQKNEKRFKDAYGLTKEDYQFILRYRPFARFISQDKFDKFIDGLLKERQIRKRIAELKEYRSKGITSLAKIEQYVKDVQRREQESKRDRAYQYSTYSTNRGTSRASRYRSYGDTPMSPASKTIITTRKQQAQQQAIQAQQQGEVCFVPADFPSYPGYELLSQKEREFCKDMRIFPKQYMLAKEIMVNESTRLGFLTKSSALKLLGQQGMNDEKPNRFKISRIYDFVAHNGWIVVAPSTRAF